MMNHPMLKCEDSRHRIIVSVQNPSRLLREVDARRAKYVNELVGAATDCFGRKNRRRRDDRDRWATAQFVIVVMPEILVYGPRPAQMMDKFAVQRNVPVPSAVPWFTSLNAIFFVMASISSLLVCDSQPQA
jgi:hypothetical protein